MKFLNEGSMSDVYYTFQDIANNPDYSDADAIAQIKNVMIIIIQFYSFTDTHLTKEIHLNSH